MGPAHHGGRDFCGLMIIKGPNRAGSLVRSRPANRPGAVVGVVGIEGGVVFGVFNLETQHPGARGVAAFLLFLLPKPSDEAEQRQQMVPRAHMPNGTTTACAILTYNPSGWRDQMKASISRREFITLRGATDTPWAR